MENNNTLQLTPVTRKLKAVRSQWMGEFQDSEGNNIGSLYKIATGTYRVYRLREFGAGEVEAESRVLSNTEIERSGSMTVSGSNQVRFYRMK
jgi:hypothetical protein